MSTQQLILRISVSFILAFLIGFERQYRRRSVGFRTYALVSIGSFLFVTFSVQTNSGDFTRIAAQVVSGMGFLGAGVILKDGSNIKGLNTAATLWCCAAIGVLCATGLLFEATIGTIFILFSNIILRFIGKKMDESLKHKSEETYTIKICCYKDERDNVRSVLSQNIVSNNMLLKNIETQSIDDNKCIIRAKIVVSVAQGSLIDYLINQLNLEEGILSLGWDKEDNKNKDDIDEEI